GGGGGGGDEGGGGGGERGWEGDIYTRRNSRSHNHSHKPGSHSRNWHRPGRNRNHSRKRGSRNHSRNTDNRSRRKTRLPRYRLRLLLQGPVLHRPIPIRRASPNPKRWQEL